MTYRKKATSAVGAAVKGFLIAGALALSTVAPAIAQESQL
jgi:hypothetical protein